MPQCKMLGMGCKQGGVFRQCVAHGGSVCVGRGGGRRVGRWCLLPACAGCSPAGGAGGCGAPAAAATTAPHRVRSLATRRWCLSSTIAGVHDLCLCTSWAVARTMYSSVTLSVKASFFLAKRSLRMAALMLLGSAARLPSLCCHCWMLMSVHPSWPRHMLASWGRTCSAWQLPSQNHSPACNQQQCRHKQVQPSRHQHRTCLLRLMRPSGISPCPDII